MTERRLLVCDRCGRTGEAEGALVSLPVGWSALSYSIRGHLCPGCTAVLRAWIDHKAELNEPDPTTLVAHAPA